MWCRLGYFRPWGELSLRQGQGLPEAELALALRCAACRSTCHGTAPATVQSSAAIAQLTAQWPLISTAWSITMGPTLHKA